MGIPTLSGSSCLRGDDGCRSGSRSYRAWCATGRRVREIVQGILAAIIGLVHRLILASE
jgi:hypothetical protein